MASDTDLARSLLALIETSQQSQAFVRDPCRLSYSYDGYLDLEGFTDAEIQVSPVRLTHTLQARNSWTDDATIQVAIVGKATERALDGEEIDGWLEFIDEIVGKLKTFKPEGKKALRIETRDRFDRQRLRTANVFSTTYTVVYSLI